MNTNEAPEKLYFFEGEPILSDRSKKREDANIEYINKDAFIEKVLDYIENNIYDHYDGDNEYGICSGYVKKEEFIKNFKDYIKGD